MRVLKEKRKKKKREKQSVMRRKYAKDEMDVGIEESVRMKKME